MGGRGRRRGSQGRAQGRVRNRVRDSARGGGRTRGGQKNTGRRQGPSLDAKDLEGYARRLGDAAGRGGGPGLSGGAVSGLAGAASGLAGGGLAQRFLGGNAEGSDEEFRKEVLDQLALMDERLRQLEDQVLALSEGGIPEEEIIEEPLEPGGEPDAYPEPGRNP